MTTPETHSGYTLTEMLLVLALLVILISIALPGYHEVLLKSRRKAATGLLQVVASRQESYRLNYHSYGTSLGQLGFPDPLFIDAYADPTTESDATYRLELILVEGRYEGVRAVATNEQRRDRSCPELQLDRRGDRRVVGATATDTQACW